VAIPLTPERIAAAYTALCSFPPFCDWRLPPASEITFRVIRSKAKYADYSPDPHTIRVSAANVGQLSNLFQVVAHEMIHLHQRVKGRRNWETHGLEFRLIAGRVCKVHGWDFQAFV